jgi:hypothetical protein
MNYKVFHSIYSQSHGSFHEFLKAEEAASSALPEAEDNDKWYSSYHKAAQMGCSPVNGEIEVVADRLALL